jgi:hypothetical protein
MKTRTSISRRPSSLSNPGKLSISLLIQFYRSCSQTP